MEKQKFSNWWFLALNGAVFAVFGLLILFFTEEFIKTILLWFGIAALVAGGVLLFAGINNIRRDKAGAMVLMEAIIALATGLALIFFPEASVALFLILIGIWAIITGIIQLVLLVNLKGQVTGKNLFLLNGLLTVLLGVALLFNPFGWGVFLVKLTGLAALLFGAVLIWFGLSVRRYRES